MLKKALFLVICIADVGFSATDPYSKSAAEVEAIVKSVEVSKSFPKQAPIDSIERRGDANYMVKSNGCSLGVDIKYVTDSDGSTQINAIPNFLVCLN